MGKIQTDLIDFVIPWVDGGDQNWQNEYKKYAVEDDSDISKEVRFRDWDNLQYWFRAVETYAPWVNKIHFITWGHVPAWLNTDYPKLNIVKHNDYIPEKYLPTFNSHVIELNLHRIPALSEKFVYFNDDIFLTAPVKETDFFRNGLPCDTFALNCIYFGFDSVGHINGSNLEVINSYIKKNAALKKSGTKWFHPGNGLKSIVRTSLLMPWPWFPGFYYQHLTNSYRKSTFEKVWSAAPEVLEKTCNDKFRQNDNVNQWVFKFWQLASGEFSPQSPSALGVCFHLKEQNFEQACEAVKNRKYKMICLNDTRNTKDFENKKREIKKCFQQVLPQKSSFER